MSQKAVDKIEQRFQLLAKNTGHEVWSSAKALISLSQDIEKTDIYLARRVLQRARNLEPNNPQLVKELTRLSNEISQKARTTQVSTSTEQISSISEMVVEPQEKYLVVKNAVKNVQSYLAQAEVKNYTKPWIIFLIFPFICFAFYQIIWASPRFESRAQLIVQQPDGMATMDASMALLSGLGVSSNATADTQLVKAYIHSEDMLNFLQTNLDVSTHYQDGGDLFSRLTSSPSREELLDFYINHTNVEIDEKSGVIKIFVQGFTPEFANLLTQTIVNRSEWYINSIGHQLAEAQLAFIQGEHKQVEARLREAQQKLLSFQQHNNLLDPEAEGAAFQQITYGLESQIAAKSAELKGLKSVMTDKAPQVVMLESELNALKIQLDLERERLSLQRSPRQNNSTNTEKLDTSVSNTAVSQILAQFADLKIELELALKGYTSSEISLDKARIEAYRQLKYLIVVESATLPDDNQYPKTTYNLILFFVIQMLVYGIGKIIIATAKELR